MRALIKIFQCRCAASAIEYALVASLIAIAAIGAMKGLGGHIDMMLNNVSNAM